MELKGISVGTRMDGSIDVDVENEREADGSSWSLSNLNLEEAEFLHDELGRAIERQKSRGFPKPTAPTLPEASQGIPAPPAEG